MLTVAVALRGLCHLHVLRLRRPHPVTPGFGTRPLPLPGVNGGDVLKKALQAHVQGFFGDGPRLVGWRKEVFFPVPNVYP